MEIDETLSQINEISTKSEQLFLQLGNLFPSLLNREGGTALQELSTMLNSFTASTGGSSENEEALFTDYAAKYNPLFEKLNEKIEDLGKLDKMIAEIKEDSEQMELIALNAMVISIKSGEKGQAFSRITENLQRLSKDMFQFSDKLNEEEQMLLSHINTLKQIFSGILDAQRNLSTKDSSGSSDIKQLITNVSMPINSMESSIENIYQPIQKAMEGLQMQDMIRQALDHVLRCLQEISKSPAPAAGSDEELDFVSFNIALYQLCEEVLKDTNSYISQSISNFDKNWGKVIEILDNVEESKNNFEQRFLSDFSVSTENIEKRLSKIVDSFKAMMDEFNSYYIVQKDLLHTCQNITEKARLIYAVFDNLRPVMSRLHHVRILQQIEVAKNDAIKSVQDSVTDMDNLISSANLSLDTMQALLESFIADTSSMLNTFTTSITKDNENMVKLRAEKTKLFGELQEGQARMASIIQNFTVFPSGFQQKCVTVQQGLQDLKTIETKLENFVVQLDESAQTLQHRKTAIMNEKGISSWQIKNSKFSNLLEHFTITAHKEAAGKIGGFSIEKGSSSGEVTLF
jgi:hypothetical protein